MAVGGLPGGFNENWRGGNELPDSTTSKRAIACVRGATSSDSKQKCPAGVIINGELKEYRFVLKFVD